jgi:hypothetical protein
MLLCCAACKRQQGAGSSERPAAAPDDGWTTFEDAHFRLAVPQGQTVKTGRQSDADPAPTFSTFKGQERAGTLSFLRYDPRSDLPVRDAAELELKDYVSEGGRVLAGVRAVPMKTGRCAAFAAVSDGVGCQAVFQGACSQHYFLAHCDGPDKKRYIFIGDLGATDSVDRRPPGFAENAAAFERVLRSIEFKPAKS